MHSCIRCHKTFSREFTLKRHTQTCRNSMRNKRHKCTACSSTFTTHYGLKRHQSNFHTNEPTLLFACGVCEKRFEGYKAAQEHRRTHLDDASQRKEKVIKDFVVVESAFRQNCMQLRHFFPENIKFVDEAIKMSERLAINLIEEMRRRYRMFKIGLILHVEFIKLDRQGEIEQTLVTPFRARNITVRPLSRSFIADVTHAFYEITENISDFVHLGSGWSLNDMLYLGAEISKCQPLTGACGLHEVVYRKEKGISITSEGFSSSTAQSDTHKDCFYRAVASHFIDADAEHKNEAARDFAGNFFKKNVKNPVSVDDISKFERANTHMDISINVIWIDERKKIWPVHLSSYVTAANRILLMLCTTKNAQEEEENHYIYIDDPEKILPTRVRSAKDGKTRKLPRLFCFNCFTYATTITAHQKHIEWCHSQMGRVLKMPKAGDTIHYEERDSNKIRAPYVVFFDFETLNIEPKQACSCPPDVLERSERLKRGYTTAELEEEILYIKNLDGYLNAQENDELLTKGKTAKQRDRIISKWARKRTQIMKKHREPPTCQHKTKILYDQVPFSFNLIMVDRNNEVKEEMLYTGDDAAEVFIKKMIHISEKYLKPLKEGGEAMKPLTPEQLEECREKRECWICEFPFQENDRVVRDHDHLTGNFLGLAHNRCNLNRREQTRIFAFAHNFSGYDSHILMKTLGKINMLGKVEAIPLNTQKFKMLSFHNITFLDSAAFLPDSLDRLASTLVASDHDFPLLKKSWPQEDDRRLLLRKGVYPYAFATSIKKLQSTEHLPQAEDFLNLMGNVEVDKEDYAHARNVWDHFGCKNMVDYTELYVRTDVYLLAEALTEMRESIWNEFGLELCSYLSLPMLAKDVMLKTTGVEIDLIENEEMAQFFRQNIRGGVSFVNTRLFDINETSKDRSIAYVDANNLYGAAMSHSLPISDFKWMTEREINQFDPYTMISEESDIEGYVLEVTLKYPAHLHLDHNSFPLAPEHIEIDIGMLSPYAGDAYKLLKNKRTYTSKKLTATFQDRVQYVCHGLNLKFYLEQGLELIEIHRGIKFRQSDFLKPYIQMCTRKRASAKTKCRSDLMKLLSNSLYGKMIEGSSNRMDCHFATTEDEAEKRCSHPLFAGSIICGENLTVHFRKKKYIDMRMSWAVGFSILEISKYKMQKMMYTMIKPAFGGRVSTLMSDTDSYVLLTPCPSVDEAIQRLMPIMDCSNYTPEHVLFDPSRKNQLGFIKNEIPNDDIVKFAGIRAKSYAFQTASQSHNNKAKGVKKIYKNKITFQEYEKCILEICELRVNQVSIQSKDHQNMLVSSERVAFSSFDDKRYLLCARHSVPYGSCVIKISEQYNECFFCLFPNLLV